MNWMRENSAVTARERADRERLRQAGHAFEEHVAVGEQADEEAVHEVLLADDDACDFGSETWHPGAGGIGGGHDVGVRGLGGPPPA